MTEERKHAILSPSGAAGWLTCIRKPLAEKGLPDNGNEYSDEGTCAHAVAALCLTEHEPASEYVGRSFDVGSGRKYVFREDMVEPVQLYVDLVADYRKSLPGSELHVEVKVPIGEVTGEEGATGTADVVILGLDELISIDLKFGAGVEVSAERNPQAMLYAGGARRELDVMGSIKRVRCVIIQPRIKQKPSEWDCTVEQLEAFEKHASERAAMAMSLYTGAVTTDDPMYGYAASEKACTFCKAKSTCPAFANFVVDTTGVGFEDLTKTPPAEPQVPDDLAALGAKFRAIPMLELFCKAVRAKAEGLLFEHNNSPEVIAALGIKIVQGKQGNREWVDDEAAAKLLKGFRIKDADMYSMKLRSPTQMEKFIKANGKKGWWEKAEALIERAPGKPSVADVSDPRPALKLEPTSDGFEAIPETQEATA